MKRQLSNLSNPPSDSNLKRPKAPAPKSTPSKKPPPPKDKTDPNKTHNQSNKPHNIMINIKSDKSRFK